MFPGVEVFIEEIPQCQVFVFSGESNVFACFFAFPVAESVGFQIVDFHGPVPGHFNDLGDGSEVETRFRFLGVFLSDFPEEGFIGFGGLEPVFALFSPVLKLMIAIIFPKAVVFAIGNKHVTRLELFDFNMFVAELVVPPVSCGSLFLTVPFFLESLH